MHLSAHRPEAAPNPPAEPQVVSTQAATAAQRVLASELNGRSSDNDALSMMMSSMVQMVQAGQSKHSRWKSS